MSTNFYLADERYMDLEEIEDANRFDASALICRMRWGTRGQEREGYVFSMAIADLCLSRLIQIRDARVISDNDPTIQTVGGLIDAARKSNNTLLSLPESEARMREGLKKTAASRSQDAAFCGIIPTELPPSRSKVWDYINREPKKPLLN